MRLPNGFGNVSKLPGNRRNPWRARKTSGWEIDPVSKKARQTYITVGYYPTRQKAMQALAEYNKNPYDVDSMNITFAEVYERWSAVKFEKISASNVNGYKAAYKACRDLHDMRMRDIRLSHLQATVDGSGRNHPTKRKIKVLLNQVFEYAVMNEIIQSDKNMVQYVDIGAAVKSTLHYRFTRDEIDALWRWSNGNDYVKIILMLIYSGVRPGELFDLKCSSVDLENGFFTVERGKNNNAVRKVPIHNRTLPFFRDWASKGGEYLVTNLKGSRFRFQSNHASYIDSFWDPVLDEIGILYYKNDSGERVKHLPDDTRHTFTTMWREQKLDEAMRRKIQGHSGKGIGEIVYTHFDLIRLRDELNLLM